MFTTYYRSTVRHWAKNPVNFSFKLLGLVLSLASLAFIAIYLNYQWSFDRFHAGNENIFRINTIHNEDGKMVSYATAPQGVGPELKAQFSEIVTYACVGRASEMLVQANGRKVRLGGFTMADSSVFSILTFKFIQGNRREFGPDGSVIITESLGKQLFGDINPINNFLIFPENGNKSLLIKGVVEDLPANSHFQIRAILSFSAFEPRNLHSLQISTDESVSLLVRLRRDANLKNLETKATSLIRQKVAKKEDGSEKQFTLYFQNIRDIYLAPPVLMEYGIKGNQKYVSAFLAVGIFLILIASVNYVNLSISDFEGRRKEMGVRKILGAPTFQIGMQAIFDVVSIMSIAGFISVGLLYAVFPVCSEKLESHLEFVMLWNRDVIATLGVILVSITFLSVIYPYYLLTTKAALQELKPDVVKKRGLSAGSLMLFVQFVISIICITATIIVGNQVRLFKFKDLGFDRSGVLTLFMPEEYPPRLASVLKNELSAITGVASVSYSYYLMTGVYFKDWYFVERNGKMTKVLLNEMFVDHDFFKTMNVKILDGRSFDIGNVTDIRTAFIVNETAAKEFGWTTPVGKRMRLMNVNDPGGPWEGTVVGLVKDFNTRSLNYPIEPVVLRLQYDSWPGNCLNIRITGSSTETLPLIMSAYERLFPGFVVDYQFLNDIYLRQYENEEKAFASLKTGTVVVLLISCFGIFSISVYSSIKRMKEFGIRKMAGATSNQIIFLHVTSFLKIAAAANLVALPISYLLLREWLNDFAYKTEFKFLIFAFIVAISFLVVTVSSFYSAWKAGRMNPIEVLKIQ